MESPECRPAAKDKEPMLTVSGGLEESEGSNRYDESPRKKARLEGVEQDTKQEITSDPHTI